MKSFRKCFISAEFGVPLNDVQDALQENDVDWQWSSSVSSNPSLVDSTIASIRSSDFQLTIVDAGPINADVMLEMGIAIGLGKPVLLLTTPNSAKFSDKDFVAHFETNLRDKSLLSLQIELFLKSAKNLRAKRAPKKHAPVTQTPRSHPKFDSNLEASIATSISLSGGSFTVPDRKKGAKYIPDLLMWMPSQDADLFNPAAIEVKGSFDRIEIKNTAQSLKEFIENSSMSCGLVVYEDGPISPEQQSAEVDPRIFFFRKDIFTNLLEKGHLSRAIFEQRNRRSLGGIK